MAEEEVVLIPVALALHERPHLQDAVDGAEAEPLDVERLRLLATLLRDVERQVADPKRMRAAVARDLGVPAVDMAQHVARPRLDADLGHVGDREPDRPAAFVRRVEDAVCRPRARRGRRRDRQRLRRAPRDCSRPRPPRVASRRPRARAGATDRRRGAGAASARRASGTSPRSRRPQRVQCPSRRRNACRSRHPRPRRQRTRCDRSPTRW